uniref:ATP synthase subunit a n=1 Tax=Magicicada tredecim TaxID=52805 RepID=A0A088DQM5_9HEMI|nr:ATP synthase F0 subunit 6 [Magicicada tredecim]AIM19527.1 ATP synthase F0 subunit 6 [Magicicada tredecim]AWV83540.1 ATP synthase F0 subunit 6 [Magicicada tredecim]AWV83553.1 ATP synthase F0 subunit 6 [Magicicada tredecim]AWV83566.1 ATP synthase F0 subunit 6 [Magicicada tredecim]AWV83579.1 ATP synthase F0 subunit 6 [Magicicada tredecim]
MMTNLFSTFDPSTGLFSLNWLSSLILLLFMPMSFWYIPNRYMIFINKILNTMSFELNLLMNLSSLGSSLLFCSLFIFILFNNFLGLFPYIFTSSSHLVFSLSLSLPLWLTFVLFGFLNNTNHMFCHLVPMGTPTILMPFMVCIETVSNLIRSGSLAVRLTANMIAGHLLMTLLGESSINSEIYMNMIILIQMLLMLFESAVCVIQSYVFTVLSTLYYSEVS